MKINVLFCSLISYFHSHFVSVYSTDCVEPEPVEQCLPCPVSKETGASYFEEKLQMFSRRLVTH